MKQIKRPVRLTAALLTVLLLSVGCLPACREAEQPPVPTQAQTNEAALPDTDPETSAAQETVPAATEAETQQEGGETDVMHPFSSLSLKEEPVKGIHPTTPEKKTVLEKADAILNDLSLLPMSFDYGSRTITGLGGFTRESVDVRENEKSCTADVVCTYADTLRAELILTVYPDYAAMEWTVYFSSVGDKETEVLSHVNAADITFTGAAPVIKGITGDGGTGNGPYSAYEKDLAGEGKISFANETGRPNEGENTYYNLLYGDGGVFISIGWPGCWKASFTYDTGAQTTAFTAGQRYLTSKVLPGETLRTPLMSFLFYEGQDENRAANLWRHWMMDCNLRFIGGKPLEPALMSSASWKYSCMEQATDENQCAWIRDYLKGGVHLDYFWMDAGWYYKQGTTSLSSWLESGNWNVDKSRFPSGMAFISDYAAENDCKTILWFEPEVVRLPNASLDPDGIRPEWILGTDGQWRLANYGNPDFVDWLTNRVISILKEGKISLYRQDFGYVSPVNTWKAADGRDRDRVGITENLYVQGYLRYWDNLIAWNPDLMIDTCASGGNRIDLETLRRSVPLHKTDYDYSDQNEKQAMSQSLFAWVPYFGAVTTGPDVSAYTVSEYDLYSSFAPAVVLDYVPNASMNWGTMSALCGEWENISRYYYADYYPLTSWSKAGDVWRGWEFFDPETDGGFCQLFRAAECPDASCHVCLCGLDPDTVYIVTDRTGVAVVSASGSSLMTDGFDVTLEQREAVLLRIEKK